MRSLLLGLLLSTTVLACRVGTDPDGSETIDGDPFAAEYMEDFANPVDRARLPACRDESYGMPEYRTCLDSLQTVLEGEMAVLVAVQQDSIRAYAERGVMTSSYHADTVGWRAALEGGQDAFETYRRTQCGGDEALVDGQVHDFAGWVTYQEGAVNGSQPEIPECHIILLRQRIAILEDAGQLRMPPWD